MDRGVARILLVRSSSLFLLLAAVAIAIIVVARAAEPRDPRLRGPRARLARQLDADRCEIAGSGSNVPLVRRLAALFEARHGARIIIHDSIGSGGGVRAVLDGEIHLGMISRPLSPHETRSGLRTIPHARVPVVLGAHPSVRDPSLSMRRLADLVEGREVPWSDRSPAVLLARERTDSSLRVLLDRSSTFRGAFRRALGRTHWRVLLHDTEMVGALADTPGSVGLLDLGVLRLGGQRLSIVRIDGLDPLASDYPFMKELAFVTRSDPRGTTARFLAFLREPDARQLALAAGYRLVQ